VIRFPLIHPPLLAALGAAGHGGRVLSAEANYSHSTNVHPGAALIHLNLRPGVGGQEVGQGSANPQDQARRLAKQPANLIEMPARHLDARAPRSRDHPLTELMLRDRARHRREVAIPIGCNPPHRKPVLIQITTLIRGQAERLPIPGPPRQLRPPGDRDGTGYRRGRSWREPIGGLGAIGGGRRHGCLPGPAPRFQPGDVLT
jgi:hypothetical protein